MKLKRNGFPSPPLSVPDRNRFLLCNARSIKLILPKASRLQAANQVTGDNRERGFNGIFQ